MNSPLSITQPVMRRRRPTIVVAATPFLVYVDPSMATLVEVSGDFYDADPTQATLVR